MSENGHDLPASRRAVLFDLDGTLIDTLELIRRSFWHTQQAHGYEQAGRDFWRRGSGRPLEVQFRSLTEDAAERAAMIRTYREFNARVHDELVTPYPGVQEALERLSCSEVRLGIVTSKARYSAERGLTLTGLERFFEVLVCADEVRRPKPDPEPVTVAMQRLEIGSPGCAFVGDSPFDLRCGKAAGVATVAVTWGAATRAELEAEVPDRWLHQTAQIAEL